MKHATVRFYGALNDFLPPWRRGAAFLHAFTGSPAVKDVIESLGPPHPEVDLVLVDGRPVGFGHRVEDGVRISAYPAFQAMDVGTLPRVGPPPLDEARFVLDVGLGRLAAFLRMLGFDTLWRNDFTDAELARISHGEERILLSRDVGVLKRGEVVHGYFPRATEPERQLVEVVARYRLAAQMRPFTRCLACNAPLVEVPLAEVAPRLPARVRERHAQFLQCPECLRVFWAGTHHARMQGLVERLREVGQQP
ncbi:MAG: Mut7-C ubiquitin/RNAse domain-containing protein [Myxococcaceae bacterium]|nr:Mut7-C ubiquitin/RNAse domain-containing protein [Myxococcaceae bacterium]MCI0673751.1 Mut7-C ubiquitin/RNAse domain-containing protein [Myxococcaceae bacterium]